MLTEKPNRIFEIQLEEHEHFQLKRFCVMTNLEPEVFVHLYSHSMYNFIVQYLMVQEKDGT